jgi:hypothetical protein
MGSHTWLHRLGLHRSGAQQEGLQEEGLCRQLQVLTKEVALCQDQVEKRTDPFETPDIASQAEWSSCHGT